MFELTGKNLPQRQRELNKNVNDAISNKVNFGNIQSFKEDSDVDRLFKIDVASKYRNSEYIIEQLKCGDTLYISRALKSEWLYNDDFSHIINPDYLQHNVIPWMSQKMKKKLLITISCHVRNEERMLNFYKYCKEIKLEDIAYKFLIFTSETCKLEYIRSINVTHDWMGLQNFFGNSFSLVEAYLGQLRGIVHATTNDKIIKFCYLYSVSNEKYLNLLERYSQNCSYEQRLGVRHSKNIMTKHKERVIKNPALYIQYVNIDVMVKYTTVEEAKQYAVALLPCNVNSFWSMNFYETYSIILNLLPVTEIYHFLKNIFKEKYQNEPFEMSRNFYYQNYHQLLTIDERELWALKHIEEKKELLGVGEDFQWYKFVNFGLAFKEIKKYIYKTVDKSKRGEIVNVLIYSIRNEQQLETLIKYYYERHINEVEYYKQDFIDKLIEMHNVFKFNEICWNAFYKILNSMSNFTSDYLNTAKGLAIIHFIIHNKEIPENLQINEIDNYGINYYFKPYFKYLTEEQIQLIYEYFINTFSHKIKEFDDKEYDNKENKASIRYIISSTLDVLICFKKTKHDCPDNIYKYIKLDWDTYKDTELFSDTKKDQKYTEKSLIRLLKQDTAILLNTLPDVINSFDSSRHSFHLNNLMKKVRIYFSNDIAKDCIKLFETFLLKDSLSKNRYIAYASINGIFHVANDNYKIDFMSKYTPKEPKISHDTIDRNTLMIQESICRFSYYSRPPIPLPMLLQFIKGDYLKYCLPMLTSCVANFPKGLSLEFITAILDAPVSLQKHGLRLAFKYFNTEDLKEVIVNVWKKSKNVSLRKVLYKSLFDYIHSADENLQQSLYEILKFFTMDLNEDDDDEVFSLIRNYFPKSFKGDYVETAWKTIKKFSDQNSKNVDRKIIIIREIENHICYVNKEFCRISILDELVDSASFKGNVEMSVYNKVRIVCQKWSLAVKYITNYDNDKELDRSLEFVSIVVKSCVKMSEKMDIKFTMYQFLSTFLEKVLKNACIFDNKTPGALPLLEYIINLLLELMPIHEIYLLHWNYSITIISIKVTRPNMIVSETGKETYEYLSSNEIATRFTNELLLFMNSLKDKNLLFPTFFDNIAIVISNSIVTLSKLSSVGDVTLFVINRLTDIQSPETFLLAVLFFYERYSSTDYSNTLNIIYDKVMKSDYEEVKAIMYQKFLSKTRMYF